MAELPPDNPVSPPRQYEFDPQQDEVIGNLSNSMRWVAAPLTRLAVRTLDPSGGASWPVSVLASEVGTTVCYQGYLRDVAHPDGTGAGLSDALRVVRHD